jgi:hypothetical protein
VDEATQTTSRDAATEDVLGVEGNVSAMQSQVYPPKEQTKSKYHTQIGCGNAEMEDAQGVEGKDSASKSLGYPPKYSKSWCSKHPRRSAVTCLSMYLEAKIKQLHASKDNNDGSTDK